MQCTTLCIQLQSLTVPCVATRLPAQNPDSEAARKKSEADRLRAAEKFMVIGAGAATCKGCGYEYKSEKGDPEFPVPKGTKFEVGGALVPQGSGCMVGGAL